MQRLRMKIAYDGSPFFGWQKQPNLSETIQETLESVISKITQSEIRVVGSGRTDRGVHALNQWAHFDLPSTYTDLSNLRYKINRMTPESIWVRSLESAPQEFHAQISAKSKCYKYRLSPGLQQSPFHKNNAWVLGRPVDEKSLQKMASIFLGEHDFSSFQSQGTPVSSPIRKILVSRWVRRKSGILEYQIQGSGFLKQMVRNMVGTMLKVEQLQISSNHLKSILKGLDRSLAAAPAPPQGLFLTSVQYPKSLDNKCRKL